MRLLLNDDYKTGLKFLSTLDSAVSLCSASVALLRAGNEQFQVSPTLQSVCDDATKIRSCIESVLGLLSESVRLKLSDEDFKASLESLSLKEEVSNELISLFASHQTEIRSALTSLDNDFVGVPAYNDLQWRFEVKTSSRALKNQLEPNVLLNLELEKGNGSKRAIQLDCSPNNLLHLRDTLEEALSEAKSQHILKLNRQTK